MAGLLSRRKPGAGPLDLRGSAADAAAERPTSDYPAGRDVPGLPDRRAAWTARLLSVLLLASTILNVVLGMTISALLPLKEIRPFLVQVADERNVFVALRPIEEITAPEADGQRGIPVTGMVLLTQQLLGEYVRYRHEIVRSTAVMEQRWLQNGLLSMMSTQEEFARFQAATAPIFAEMRQNDVTQEVLIESINLQRRFVPGPTPQQSQPGVALVQFRLIGRGPDARVIADRSWNATIEFGFYPIERIPAARRFLNPTGFVVTSYTLAERIPSAPRPR
jgi:type IV secretory pathway component VirB8